MELPKREKTFHFEHVGESGFHYEGTFTIKCRLNVAEKYAMELERNRLIGDMSNPTDDLTGFALVISTLRAKVTDGPNWWLQSRGFGMEDEDALVNLYAEVEKTSTQWKQEILESASKRDEVGN